MKKSGGLTSEGLTIQRRQSCVLLLTRPGWHGPYHRGHCKCVKAAKRQEAADRMRPRPTAPNPLPVKAAP